MSANAAESMMAPPLTATISPVEIGRRANRPRPAIGLVRFSVFWLNQLLMKHCCPRELNSCASAGANLLEAHPKRKGDKHNSEAACGQVVEFATWVERPTYRTCSPCNAHIHRHHDDRQDRPQ